ncbi:MAG: Rrf2 family transcriptional regulator [Sphingobium sp.]|nr:Rrf2 family transcriptional regulator [Sphingobium sp.]
MKLTRFSDYAMRVMLDLGRRPGELVSIAALAKAHNISQNHLMKVVSDLVNAGYLESIRGRSGGIRLARAPETINVGALLRHTEDDLNLVSCADCILMRGCGFNGALGQAMGAFMQVLDGYTLADLLTGWRGILNVPEPA